MSQAYISIHCDGCALGNPGKAGWGAVLRWRGHRKEISGSIAHATNNVAELTAAIEGLRAIKKDDQLITLYSDSQYVIKGGNGEWKIKTNHDLWREFRKEIRRHREVILNWIPRQQNAEADRLANKGARSNG